LSRGEREKSFRGKRRSNPPQFTGTLEKIFQKNLKNPLTNPLKCDIIKTQKGERQQNQASKKIKKIQKRA
jgi:hypothetical protein